MYGLLKNELIVSLRFQTKFTSDFQSIDELYCSMNKLSW